MTPVADPVEERLLSDVQTFGWHVVRVLSEGETPGWAYTVGLSKTFGHPEIVLFGLPPTVAHIVLNTAGTAVAHGTTFALDTPYDDFLEEYACVFRPVQERWTGPFVSWTRALGASPSVLQLFWPDRDHHLPWEADAPTWLQVSQPLLFAKTIEEARVALLLATLEA